VSETAEELDRFYLAHRRCGALTVLVPFMEEGPELDLDHPN